MVIRHVVQPNKMTPENAGSLITKMMVAVEKTKIFGSTVSGYNEIRELSVKTV